MKKQEQEVEKGGIDRRANEKGTWVQWEGAKREIRGNERHREINQHT